LVIPNSSSSCGAPTSGRKRAIGRENLHSSSLLRRGGVLAEMRISFAFPLRRDFRVLRYPRTTLPLLITRASYLPVSRVPNFSNIFVVVPSSRWTGHRSCSSWGPLRFYLGERLRGIGGLVISRRLVVVMALGGKSQLQKFSTEIENLARKFPLILIGWVVGGQALKKP